MNALGTIILHDLRLAYRAGGTGIYSTIFFFLVALVFSLAIGPDLPLLALIAPAVLWASALLATIVSLDRLFRDDIEDGSINVLLEITAPFAIATLAKALTHWISTFVPLIVATPVLGLLFGVTSSQYSPLLLSLAIGSPAFSFFGMLGAAITASIKRANTLLALLVLPLMIPTLIFGVGAAKSTSVTDPGFLPQILILASISLIAGAICPLAAASAIRFNTD